MPKASMQFETVINATPEMIFPFVSRLTKHPEWSANSLDISSIDSPVESNEDQPEIGKQYRSIATVKNLTFEAELVITELIPNKRFGFRGEDSTGQFEHHFTLTPVAGGTKVNRKASFTLSLYLWLRFWILYLPVRRPAGMKAMSQLKALVEGTQQ